MVNIRKYITYIVPSMQQIKLMFFYKIYMSLIIKMLLRRIMFKLLSDEMIKTNTGHLLTTLH